MTPPRPKTTTFSSTLQTLVGPGFLQRLTDTDRERVPLRIGSQTWTTHRLATELGVVHTRAARLLTKAADSIVRDLYHRSTPYTFAGIAGLGETTLYVLWRLFESQGLDADAWAGTESEALTTFATMKHREHKAEAQTIADEARRTHRTTSQVRAADKTTKGR